MLMNLFPIQYKFTSNFSLLRYMHKGQYRVSKIYLKPLRMFCSHLSSGSLWERFVSTSSPLPHLKSQRKSEDHLGCWASPGQQDNTGKLPCQVLEKKLRHILERNLETFRLFLLTSPWKPLRMFYSHFILVASLHKSEDEGRPPQRDFRTPPSHLWHIIANLQALPIFMTRKKEKKTCF